jgi:hypothetical protein
MTCLLNKAYHQPDPVLPALAQDLRVLLRWRAQIVVARSLGPLALGPEVCPGPLYSRSSKTHIYGLTLNGHDHRGRCC